MAGFRMTRRQFSLGLMAAGAVTLGSRSLRAADFQLRQFHNQPADSPLHQRLTEMWAAVEKETGGKVRVQTFAENNKIPGGDPAAFKMVLSGELDFLTMNGGTIGTLVPAMNIQAIPFSFHTPAQVYEALDGDLGAYLQKEMKEKGLYGVSGGCFTNGMHQITCAVRPIRTAADLDGLKMRAPEAPIYVEAWKALGCTPVAVNINKLYETLKSGAADAQGDPLSIIEGFKLYEVQKYCSLTSHLWTGFNLLANLKVWQSLPADAQQVIERNAKKYVGLQRADNDSLNASLRPKLESQGMVFNEPDSGSFRGRLGGFYAQWKQTIGQQAWSLLEGHVGKLG